MSVNLLSPDPTERLARARADVRMGLPVVITCELQKVLVIGAEVLTADRLSGLQALGAGLVLALTARRAETLRARAYDGDLARVAVPADAQLPWLAALADPATDLSHPMKGPLSTLRDGDDTMHRAGLSLLKSARLLPAAVVAPLTGPAPDGLTSLRAADILGAARQPLEDVVSARVPLEVNDKGRVHVFRPDDGGEEHYAIEIGNPDRAAPVLSRLHSACFTGDLMGSLKCDCGPQLRAALAQMGAEGAGVLLYLNQEGRGIGLANKMRAYALQDQGFDTVEANHRLGFEDDERDFRLGSDILKRLGFSQVRLMTNNPNKIARMESSGLKVTERVALKVGETAENAHYLATKVRKSGHLL